MDAEMKILVKAARCIEAEIQKINNELPQSKRNLLQLKKELK